MAGQCLTAEECDGRAGGSKSGNCASGFGVCCLTVIDDATANPTITTNLTYIQNTGYPTAVTTGTTATAFEATYMINGGEGISQIRLDFAELVTDQPTAGTGLCAVDIITVSQSTNGATTGLPLLCGTLTGQHVYIDHGTTTASQISIGLNQGGTLTTNGRSWKILVSLIEDGSPSKAPAGCRQYFTAPSGVITSLNAVNGNAIGVILGNGNYKACVRKGKGNSCIAYRQARSGTATPDAFNLANPTVTMTGSEVGTNCVNDMVVIDNTRYCGAVFNHASGSTEGSVVYSTGNGILVTTSNANRVATSAFELRYTQRKSCP